MTTMNTLDAWRDSFSQRGNSRGGWGPDLDTELQSLLIGPNPRRNWLAYLKQNARRRAAGLPLGNVTHLVAVDELEWLKEMTALGAGTIEDYLRENPMPRDLFAELQVVSSKWGMGQVIPHLWLGSWFASFPFSEVPRFRIDLQSFLEYPARVTTGSHVDDYQRAQASIGIDPGEWIRPDPRYKTRIADGRAARSEGIYAAGGYIHNAVLRRGQIGYPVVLEPIEAE